jgi:hypothetical protein
MGGGGRSRQSTIKSVRGPNGRNDPVVKILNVDPAYHHDDDDDDDDNEGHRRGGGDKSATTTTIGDSSSSSSDARTLIMRSRILTACGSGVAFLWDVRVAIDRSSGSLRDLTVLPVSSSAWYGARGGRFSRPSSCRRRAHVAPPPPPRPLPLPLPSLFSPW